MGQYLDLWELLKGMESPGCDGITWVAWKASIGDRLTWKVLKGLVDASAIRFQQFRQSWAHNRECICIIDSRLSIWGDFVRSRCWSVVEDVKYWMNSKEQPIGWLMGDFNSKDWYKFYRKFVLICVYSNIMILGPCAGQRKLIFYYINAIARIPGELHFKC